MKFTRVVALFLCMGISSFAADMVEAFGYHWTVPLGADWKVENEGGTQVLRMLEKRPSLKPRRPSQYALAETDNFQKVTLEAEVKRLGGSIILVYAWRDAEHFDYAHLSVDSPKKQPVHNGIFHVYGGDRVRISNDEGPGSLPSETEWYKVKLDYDASTHTANVTVNGQSFPSLKGVDLSLGAGRVGIGSFFELALFRNVKITGTPAAK